MKNLKSSIFLKIAVITILTALLMIPTVLIKNLINEREEMHQSAIDEVSSKWGRAQTITGPYLSIPYNDSKYDKSPKVYKWVHFLPNELEIAGTINPEKRYRGIYEVVLYESNLVINGNFNELDFEKLGIDKNDVLFDKATINIGINDLKGVEKQVTLNWDGKNIPFNSGTSNNLVATEGINAVVPIKNDSIINKYSFSTEIDLKGSQFLYFTPVGKTTDVTISSNWKTPSFTGMYLPDSREVTDEGFTSKWNILNLNRNYPQEWIGDAHNVQRSAFGANLLVSVHNYKKTYRVAKYAILFLTLTFITFFFVEVLKKVFIHPIQYLLVGVAIIIFYALLLAFSEHFVFNLSYVIASILTLTLITFYAKSILKSKQLGLFVFGILFILYSFIFIIIQLDDYALLFGALGMFLILALGMYFSRKIDWYDIKLGSSKELNVQNES